jgi:ABC-type Na+ transport system ATPase subunit NatA
MYDDLTIKENISFWGIYGLSKIRIKRKTAQLIQKLQLEAVASWFTA